MFLKPLLLELIITGWLLCLLEIAALVSTKASPSNYLQELDSAYSATWDLLNGVYVHEMQDLRVHRNTPLQLRMVIVRGYNLSKGEDSKGPKHAHKLAFTPRDMGFKIRSITSPWRLYMRLNYWLMMVD
ncbi:hypothetical protein BDZ94DRAFT_1240874 [Collybia nuda]|uniref:Uncharacterized protein n=1 Tax=Collybia nuda TaxID=64659 RepID=A0A9P5XUZ1_9AGAR|nr:hypothetical protein BDZ94DRAFT_1240874 [Collybia nuda]